jgi:hypothetical protein
LAIEATGTAGGTDEACLGSELGEADLCPFGRHWKRQDADVSLDSVQERRARRRHAAAKNYHIRINGVHEIGGSDGQEEGSIFDDFIGELIACGGRIENVPGGKLSRVSQNTVQ